MRKDGAHRGAGTPRRRRGRREGLNQWVGEGEATRVWHEQASEGFASGSGPSPSHLVVSECSLHSGNGGSKQRREEGEDKVAAYPTHPCNQSSHKLSERARGQIATDPQEQQQRGRRRGREEEECNKREKGRERKRAARRERDREARVADGRPVGSGWTQRAGGME